ncbi:MAG: GNAT family N-acetyltransferase [Candidatus Thorarchaeota archaeon]
MSLVIRPVKLEDLDIVMEIERKCFPIAWEYSVFLTICMNNGRIVSRDMGMILMDVLEKSGEIIGYTVWETDTQSKRGHILNLAVIEEERRKGYAKQLIHHVHENLKTTGFVSCHLEVRESNVAARKLYENCGYVLSDRIIGYYFDEDAIEYSINL